MNNEKLNRFVSLLEGIFELDKSDLDFGIYRILNIRKDKIRRFLAEELPKKVREEIAAFADDTEKIKKRIAEIEEMCADVGAEIYKSKMSMEYLSLKSQLAVGADSAAAEADVYSDLYGFFNRYYDEGDFISKRRYKEGVYAIPYEGEEVKLHWANADQYYIKTAENFHDYTFADDSKKVHFRLVNATAEKDNNKEADGSKRVFMLYTENKDNPDVKAIEEIDGELVIRFVYDAPADKKTKYAEENFAEISKAITQKFKDYYAILRPLPAKDPKKTITLLEKHLNAYVAKNTFDYFIHKDLYGFLTRELDFFIKNEVFHIDDIDADDWKLADVTLAKVRIIKRIGKTIIDFLAQIENFQKKLWLKKKFVVETNWCITLDRVDAAFYPEIIGNAAQVAEWKEMYAIDEIGETGGDLLGGGGGVVKYTEPLTAEFLRKNGNLALDTKHFSEDFKERVLASIDNLDEETGGVLVHSENFQALSLLEDRYSGRVKCVYIDPPYNTDASEILYKNNYKDSSFLALMDSRLQITAKLMSDNAIIAVSIDDVEMPYLQKLLDYIFAKNLGIAAVRSNPQSRKAKGKFSPSHEYCLFYSKREETTPRSIGTRQEKIKRYPFEDDNGHYAWLNFIRAGNNDLRSDRPKLYYPIAVADDDSIRILKMKWDNTAEEYVLLEQPNSNETLVYPIKEEDGVSIEKNWQRGHERVKEEIPTGEYRVRRVNGDISIDFKTRMDEDALPTTWWDKKEYASSNYFPKELKALFGKRLFDFGKALMIVNDAICASGADASNAMVLDFFAGSATTGHAVLNLNRSDNGTRKYILVEMGEYFNTVTLPRMKKAVYSADWKSGKPQTRDTGVSHIMKYITLESYEDALSNISLDDQKHGLFGSISGDYMLNYMLDTEAEGSLLRLDVFASPFGYKMRIGENGETKVKTIDVCETFNYLIGLSVVRRYVPERFRAVSDSGGGYESAVKLECDGNGEFVFKRIEGELPDGGRALVIWRAVAGDSARSNAVLDAYFTEYRKNHAEFEFDAVYVNGDNNLETLRPEGEIWKVWRIEHIFADKMFRGAE